MTVDMAVVAAPNGISKRPGDTPVARESTWRSTRGKVTALLGPNGAGKTTGVSLLTGRLSP